MIKDKDIVLIKTLDNKQGRVLMVNNEFKNAYVICDGVRILVDLKDLEEGPLA